MTAPLINEKIDNFPIVSGLGLSVASLVHDAHWRSKKDSSWPIATSAVLAISAELSKPTWKPVRPRLDQAVVDVCQFVPMIGMNGA